MKVKIWGARGSVAVSGPRFTQFGGNTTCVEIQAEGERLILDGGTGLRALGAEHGFRPLKATVLFTHVHWDHIQGVPFFTPAYLPQSDLTFVGMGQSELRATLASQMKPPTFPVGLDLLKGVRAFVDARPDRPLELGPFKVTPLVQDHPDGVVSFRIEAGGKRMVFATDVEHGEAVDPKMLALAEGADLLIHDAQYDRAEYLGLEGPPRRGWGHSTWQQAVEVAQRAGARRLGLFHHDPARYDDQVVGFERSAQALHAGAFAASEGMTLSL